MKKGKSESLFGTDGIRAKYGKFPLDQGSIKRIGSVIGSYFGHSKVLFGRDTRISGSEIEEILATGLAESGSELFSSGILPTPALSYNVSSGSFDLGIMITASHNEWFDNGIKLFGPDGEKVPDDDQEKINRMFYSDTRTDIYEKETSVISYEGNKKYCEYIAGKFAGTGFGNGKIILDCANGAVSKSAPIIFSKLGIDNHAVNISPNGKNINDGCGSTVPGLIRNEVEKSEYDLGIAFDGDGDRVVMVNGAGREIDGDFILYIIAKFLKDSDPDFNPVVVGTVMSNLALERELNRMGIKFVRSDVGDRHVYEKMKQNSAVLGGEQSGHIIYRNFQKTGDGILSSLMFLRAIEYFGIPLNELSELFVPFPQKTVNIRIKEKRDLGKWDELKRMIESFNEDSGENSRILIRYSGTENKIRLMMESEEEEIINKNIEIFEKYLISEIGE